MRQVHDLGKSASALLDRLVKNEPGTCMQLVQTPTGYPQQDIRAKHVHACVRACMSQQYLGRYLLKKS